jgi:hypothetical protein
VNLLALSPRTGLLELGAVLKPRSCARHGACAPRAVDSRWLQR